MDGESHLCYTAGPVGPSFGQQMRKLSIVIALVLGFCWVSYAQNASGPEAAFLSLGKYTNAFFGFSLPLPPDPTFNVAQVSPSGMWHRLLGLGREEGNSTFVISAQQMFSSDAEKLMRAAPPTTIHGKEFSKGISHQNEREGTVWKAMYLTVAGNYLLEFEIQSLDPSMTEAFEHCVEDTIFFDPAKAKEVAGPNGRPYNPTVPQGQQVVIRFMNGTNGKPIRDRGVNIRIGSVKLFWRDTDSKGEIILNIAGAQPRELGVGPDYVFDCRSTRDSNILLVRTLKYSLDEIVSKGIVGENLCGTATASPAPGTLILFVRPRTSKEKREL
jgi:hypothetical protein